ncbi:MAG: motility associated factor glycosyltransferase family protein [Vicinamibacterales bacterium]
MAGRALPTTVCVIGAAGGAIVEVIAARSSSVRILVLEPEPGLTDWLLTRRDWRDLITSGRLLVLAGPDYDGAALAWRLLDGETDPLILVHPVIGRERLEAAKSAARTIGRAVNDWTSNRQARETLAPLYLRNTLGNLAAFESAGDVADLHGLCAGVPAIIAGAGPSLNDNLAALGAVPDLRERAVLIATDTAMRPCLAAGLAPHFAVAVDATDANACHLLGLPSPLPTWLVAEASVAPAAVAAFAHRVMLWRVGEHAPWPLLRSLGVNRGQLAVWGSVLTAATDLALQLGCDPLVFVGADLAYTGGQPYCRGTVFEATWAAEEAAGIPLFQQWRTRWTKGPPLFERGIEGGDTQTASHFMAFRDWLVDRSVQRRDRRFINASGAGILHGGAFSQQPAVAIADQLGTAPTRQWVVPTPMPGPARLGERLLSGGTTALALLPADLAATARAALVEACDRLELARLEAQPLPEVCRSIVASAHARLDAAARGDEPLDTVVTNLAAAASWGRWRTIDLIRLITRTAAQRVDQPPDGGAPTLAALASAFQIALTDDLHPGIAASAYDQLHALSWHLRTVSDLTTFSTRVVDPMRRHARRWIDSLGLAPRRARRATGLTIGYLGYNARLTGRHPTALAVLDLLRGHHASRRPHIRIEYFAWGACDDDWRRALATLDIRLHEFSWPERPCSAVAALYGAIGDAGVDVLISDQPLGVPTVLFEARSAPCRVLLDTGVGPWHADLVDLVVAAGVEPAIAPEADNLLRVSAQDSALATDQLERRLAALSSDVP